MRHEIAGGMLPSLDVHLDAGESVYTESGGMAWMTGNIVMDTSTRGGLMAGLGRALAGESLFMTSYKCPSGAAMVTFTPEAPGTILAFQLAPGQSLICQRDAFMAAQEGVQIEMYFRRKLGVGLFGGEGFILEKITGPGMVWLEISGDVRDYQLQAGEMMRVDPGHIGLYEPSVAYDVETVKGAMNVLFSGEGLFLATLKGPGRVWLQSMPIASLARKIAHYIPHKG
jgi:uncharacterized protein (TIGR00266 family)